MLQIVSCQSIQMNEKEREREKSTILAHTPDEIFNLMIFFFVHAHKHTVYRTEFEKAKNQKNMKIQKKTQKYLYI